MDGEKYMMSETSPNFYTLKVNMLNAENDGGILNNASKILCFVLELYF